MSSRDLDRLRIAWMLALVPAAVILSPAPASAAPQPQQPSGQQPGPQAGQQLVEVRVTSTQPRMAVIDRGTADGLAKQDRVVFRPREGGRFEGTIVRIGERAAVVELDDGAFTPAPGTRGDVRVPVARFAAPAQPAAPNSIGPGPAVKPPAAPAPADRADPAAQATQPPAHPPWQKVDDEWSADQPLLARVRPLHPEERESQISGRVYTIADYMSNTEGNARDVFARAGTDLLYENAFGQGGDLHFAGEVNYRKTDNSDGDDDERRLLRIDRLSYSWGGNRFTPDRFEVGRFLQHEMPEFGLLDGFEWDRRLSGGNSFGASAGFLPEPDPNQTTGRDLSVAAWYRWVADESELLSVTAGYQKTFHELDADRDLLVAKVLYLPIDAWTFSGTTWVDLYTSSDTAKGAGAEVTQAYVTTGRHWESGSALRATYTHLAFPELQRNEFLPVTAQQLADDHSDRAALYGRQALSRSVAIFGQTGAWKDQADDGGDAEGGFDVDNLLFSGSHAEVAGFGTDGRFVRTLGWRASLGATTERTAWSLGYEFTLNRIDGFQSNNNDIPQHRARASWEMHGEPGWTFSTYADVLLYDTETAVITGIMLQRSF